MRRGFVALVLCAWLAAGPAFAAGEGTAEGVNPNAAALTGSETRSLVVGSDISIGDTIKTDGGGLVEILFDDSTKLVVGPNSSLLIEDYLVRTDGSAGKFAVDMLAGSFRFITGNGPKEAYKIDTPSGTIGIRGTAFDAYVDTGTGQAYIMMYSGETNLSTEHDSELLSGLCHIGTIEVDETRIIGKLEGVTLVDRETLRDHFPFSLDQSQLLESFRLDAAPNCTKPETKIDTSFLHSLCASTTIDLACLLFGGGGVGGTNGSTSKSSGDSPSGAVEFASVSSALPGEEPDGDPPPVPVVPLPFSIFLYLGAFLVFAGWHLVNRAINPPNPRLH